MNEEMRKEFEVWWVYYCKICNLMCNISTLTTGEYESIHTRTAWFGWQASREAMKPIKLPTKMKNTQEQSCYYYNDAIDECKEAIQQAGYKVEE